MTTALVDLAPVLVLEKENYVLREENRHLHSQVHELMAWKERAVKQLVTLGAKRQRAQRDVQYAASLQRQLAEVEKSLQERSTLEHSNQLLEETETELQRQVDELQTDKQALAKQVGEWRAKEQAAREQLQHMADEFRVHLEQLVAMREQIDGDSRTPTIQEEERQDEQQQPDEELTTSGGCEKTEQRVDDPAVLIAGLGAVSFKCLRWFQQHVAQSFATVQEKAALYEAQHAELLQLRSRVHAIRQDVDVSVAKEKQQVQQLVRIQSDKMQLEMEVQKLRVLHSQQSKGHSQMSDHVRLLVTEVRQYLRLVRAEIKKKFGYVPEVITHADSWTRIVDAMDVLERQLRISSSR